MTKAAALAVVPVALLAFLASLPSALGHGAAEPREIDVRILSDNDGATGPATCFDDAPQSCEARPKGLDLLSLDVREMHWVRPGGPVEVGTPMVAFRLGAQLNVGAPDQAVEIHLKTGGAELSFGFASDATGNYVTETCTALDGPVEFPGGDGTPQAFDCYVSYSAFGLDGAGELTDIAVHSEVGGEEFDEMPGTWYLNGQTVPFVPLPDPTHPDPGALQEDTTPGSYALSGPAALLTATVSASRVDLRNGPGTIQINLANVLANTTQVATINVTVPDSIGAAIDTSTALLNPAATKTATLQVRNASKDGDIMLLVTSDLGAFQVFTIRVNSPPPATTCPLPHHNETATACPSTTTQASSKESPIPGLGWAGPTLLLALATWRRPGR